MMVGIGWDSHCPISLLHTRLLAVCHGTLLLLRYTTPPCPQVYTPPDVGLPRFLPPSLIHPSHTHSPTNPYQPNPIPLTSFPPPSHQIVALTKAPASATSPILIDVREPDELASTGRIPGALNMPVRSGADGFFLTDAEFADRFGFAAPARDAPLVFYCKAGVRSRAAAQLARQAGWADVAEYPGSWSDWVANGGEVQR
jgi:rhodanese-related sulfurtransferase